MKKIHFMLTAFRDGFQSVFGARVFSNDYLPCVEFAAKECGITHFEAGGGALFQSPFFYSNENAFDVMDAFRKAAGPNANLQTLARGISVVALKAQPKDIVKLHAEMFKKHGMTTIRNFDALNDVQNLIWSGQCIRNAGLKHEAVVTLMELPPGCHGAHEVDFYEKTLRGIVDSGLPYDSVCFKDASGTARPQKVYETIKMARRVLGDEVKIAFHSHETAGTCTTAYKGAIEAGVDQIDLALAPCSGGTSQPDVITMWHALRGTEYTLDIDINKIIKLEQMFKDAMKDYFVPPEATARRAVDSVLPDARRRAHGEHPDAPRQQADGQVSRSHRRDGRGREERRLRHLRDTRQPVLFPTGVQQRHVRPVEKNRRRLRQDGPRLFRQDARPA